MVSVGRIVSLGLFIAALGLGGASKKPDAGNPTEHRPQSAVHPETKPAAQQQAAKPPAAPKQAQPKPEVGDGGPGGHEADHDGESPKWTDIVQAISALIVMGFTLALTVVAVMQHRLEKKLAADTGDSIAIAKRSADAAKRSAVAAVAAAKTQRLSTELDLRAYVLPHKWSAKLPPEPTGKWVVTIGAQNYGRTPAHEVRCMCTRTIQQEGFPTEFHMEIPPPMATILGSGAGLAAKVEFTLSEEQAAAHKAGRATISIGATITYRDRFCREPASEERSTRFTVTCMPNGDLSLQSEDQYT